jgi:hypothetical protein
MEREPLRPSVPSTRVAIRSEIGVWATVAALFCLACLGVGCAPTVGSSCELSSDCGSGGQLVCDTSEFEGYCTVVDCLANTCPNNGGCILFYPAIPGCGYNDYTGGSRVSQPFCMATCSSNSDCRTGYVCANPTESPWYAMILDNNNTELVCLPIPETGQVGASASSNLDTDAAVCQVIGPTFDAGFPPIPDASGSDESEPGTGDAAPTGD